MGSQIGVMKTAARRVGVSFEEYMGRVTAGEKWCMGCRTFHPVAAFGSDAKRSDTLDVVCRTHKNRHARANYVSQATGAKPGPPRGAERDNDVRQARRTVNHLIETGELPRPNDVPCTDCGHVYVPGERRHEYDHYKGYRTGFHTVVQAVCTTCHHARERIRRGG